MVSEVDNRPLPDIIITGDATVTNNMKRRDGLQYEKSADQTLLSSHQPIWMKSLYSQLQLMSAEAHQHLSLMMLVTDAEDTDVNVEHSEATIEIQSPDDVWTSGLAIPIVIVDGDVNKNSRDSDDVDLTDPDSIIPTLVTGDPFTLSESPVDTWIGWNIAGNQNVTAIGPT